MNKADFWNIIWISIHKRLPPDQQEPVLIWNPATKQWRETPGYIAHEHAKKLLAGQKESFAIDRLFTHWCEPKGPK